MNIKSLAKQAGFNVYEHIWIANEYNIERLAKLVAEQTHTNNKAQWYQEGYEAGQHDMSTKPQNIDTSEERVHESDISIHDDDDIQEYKRPWIGLTEEESSDIYNAHHNTYGECITSAYELVLDVEAKLKEKNA